LPTMIEENRTRAELRSLIDALGREQAKNSPNGRFARFITAAFTAAVIGGGAALWNMNAVVSELASTVRSNAEQSERIDERVRYLERRSSNTQAEIGRP